MNICIINVYMPANGSPDFKEQYPDHLDQLNEIVNKYQETHILIGGDINASLVNPRYPHDHLTKKAFAEMGLLLTDNYPHGPTFFSHNGRDSRQIDYFLSSNPHLLSVAKPIDIPANSSSHRPIQANLACVVSVNQQARPNENANPNKRPK